MVSSCARSKITSQTKKNPSIKKSNGDLVLDQEYYTPLSSTKNLKGPKKMRKISASDARRRITRSMATETRNMTEDK